MAITLKKSVLLIETPRAPGAGHRYIISTTAGLDNDKVIEIAGAVRNNRHSESYISVERPARQADTGRDGVERVSLLGPAVARARRAKAVDAVKKDLLAFGNEVESILKEPIDWREHVIERPELDQWLTKLVDQHKLGGSHRPAGWSSAGGWALAAVLVGILWLVYSLNEIRQPAEPVQGPATGHTDRSALGGFEEYLRIGCGLDKQDISAIHQQYEESAGHPLANLDSLDLVQATRKLAFIGLRMQKDVEERKALEVRFPKRTDVSVYCRANEDLNAIGHAIHKSAAALDIISKRSFPPASDDLSKFATLIRKMQETIPVAKEAFRPTPVFSDRALAVFSTISREHKDFGEWLDKTPLAAQLSEAAIVEEMGPARDSEYASALRALVAYVLTIRAKSNRVLSPTGY